MEQVPRLAYTRNWEDPADYPTHETSEVQNRRDIQSLFSEIRAYVNDVLLPSLEQQMASGGGGGGSGGGASGDLAAYLPLSGGTMRGPLRLYRTPQFTDEAAPKSYVDTQAGLVKTDLEGNLTAVRQTAEAVEALAQDNQGNIAALLLRASGIEGRVESAEGDISLLRQLADSISLEVSAPMADGEGRVYSRLTLKLGPNELYGYIQLEGNVDVSGELSAAALYAAYGEVADLSVDRLSTSRRIARYLRGDSGDDNYIRVQEQELEFVTAECTGGAEQARNPAGEPLFWPEDVSALPLGSDGYPRRMGERVFTTTSPTDFPVRVYGYTEQVKRAIRFDRNAAGIYEPVDTYGAGNSQGNNYARAVKTTEGFDLLYVTPEGKEIGIRMGAGGYVDIPGQRRTTWLDFSGWDGGRFYERQEGAASVQIYEVDFDSENRPVRITDGDGHVLTIVW